MEKSYFILSFRLKTEKWQEDVINKRFNAGKKMYNKLVRKSLNVLSELEKTKKYRNALQAKDWKLVNQLRKDAGLSEYGLSRMMTPLRDRHHVNVDLSQVLSKNLWRAFDRMFYGDGHKVHFKEELNSLCGKTNKTGIIYRDGYCLWQKLKIPVTIKNTPFEREVFENHEIAYCQVARKLNKYYLYITFKGKSPKKRVVGNGEIGIDIGTSTIAIVSKNTARLLELADKAQGQENKKRLLLRKLDRSRRAMNPENYNPNGTIVAGRKLWKKSKRYLRTQYKLKALMRKQKDIRKYQHECLANYIVSLGNVAYVEDMNFRALQRRSKETTKTKTGRYKCKKRFGKSLANRAPAMFLEILSRKINVVKINTVEAKASQYSHITHEYKKKPLSKRWTIVGDYKIQRDLYSAFLIMNINEDLKTFSEEKCNHRFNNFVEHHNLEIDRLRNSKRKFLTSIGV